MVSLRDASPEDAGEMARIQSRALRAEGREHYTGEQLDRLAPPDPGAETIPDAEFTDDERHAVVAEKDGNVVGWGSVHLEEGVLAATFVDPDHAGSGIGRAIVEELETAARAAGLETLVVPASLNAVGFYETLGFDRQGEIDVGGPDDPGIPAVELTKRLEDG